MRYKCSNCDNELKEDSSFCPKCGYCVIHSIGNFGMGVDSIGAYKPVKTAFINPKELELANSFVKLIPELKIEHNTDSYTTLSYGGSDVCRIEYVNGGLRLQLCPSNEDRKKLIDHPFFAIQDKKTTSFWKCIYKENATDFYINVIKNTMAMNDSFKKIGG